MAASNLNLGKASGGVLNIQPADGTTTTSLILPAINGTVVAADSNGNVGIGTAPSAWRSDVKVVENIAGVLASVGSIDLALIQNATLTASSWTRNSGLPCSMYEQSSGGHYFSIAPTGTAGSAIAWTQAMSLVASGNLLVGTTTDNGVDKLQVNGSIKSIRNGRNIGQVLNISYNDNLSHNLGSGFANNNFLIEITSASGLHTIPVYSYGGDGIAYRWNALNPDTGSWINSGASSLVLTFTERGTNPNTYSLTLSNSNGSLTIQATTKNSSYNIAITTI